ncbi:hypothetical protein [Sporosarcina sp. YIM B06819]|uniref:hypothetical protein n=1 Tax=Sporosarcina sp. YIM B06819 TaxID=3081769 RepID=UPI00298C22CA|nr:hypothetical protein [Sporosarcina sp. YIM B06819]
MGLFINSQSHSDVFNNDKNLVEHNQGHSRIDSLTQWMQERHEENAMLNRHIRDLELLLQQQKKSQENQITTIHTRLNELHNNNFQYEKFERNITKSLAGLDDKQQKFHLMLAREQAVDREFRMQVSESTKEMAIKMNEQLNQQQQLADRILQQEDAQKVVSSRLDNQESMIEKMVRQLDYLRGILYERTNYLTEKIENSYTLTTSYLTKNLTNPEQQMSRFWMNPKPEEKQKSSE